MSNIPLPDLKRSDDDELLGYGLQRDLSEYDEYYPSGFEIEVEIILQMHLPTKYFSAGFIWLQLSW